MSFAIIVFYSRRKLRYAAIDRWFEEIRDAPKLPDAPTEPDFVPNELEDDGFGFLRRKLQSTHLKETEKEQELTLVFLQ